MDTRKMVLLEKWRPLAVGPLRSLSVDFCADSAVHVQLWRPTESAVDSYTLVWDKLVSSSTTTGRSIINLTSIEYINVEESYRLALQAVDSQQGIPVQKTFYLGNIVTSQQSAAMTRCETRMFDHLPYPYKFNIDLCTELGCGTRNDAASGSTGVEQARWKCPVLSTQQSMVLLEKWRPLAVGPLRSLSVEFCADSAVHVQLWRPTESAVGSYTLVWDKLVSPSTAAGRSIINLPSIEYINIEESYRLALQAVASQKGIPVQKTFYVGNIVTSVQSADVKRCETRMFDHLPYPYKFNIDLCAELGWFCLNT
ncbi:hypothetical protein LSAT2_018272 [Lamellibrachia satsuma]|nr:hypothetical protein LSAT2_018272 [Lamellibrachia satsuma]